MATFISYKFGEDRNKYENVRYALDQERIQYWSTNEIAAGQSLRDELQAAIRQCSVCIFVATPSSLSSDWCQAEIGAFWGLGRPVIVYLADESLKEGNLPPQFSGDKFASTIREVVDATKVHLAKSSGPSQLEAIALLACDSFLDKLNLQLKTNWFLGFGTLAPGFGPEPAASIRSTNAFGERVSYDTSASMTDATTELLALVKRIATLHERREREISRTLLALFKQVQGSAQSILHLLSRITFRSSTLAEPWQCTQESLLNFWQTQSKDLLFFSPNELDRLRQFLSGHLAYEQVYIQEKETIDAFLRPGKMSIDELLEATGTQLVQTMKSLLLDQ